MMSKDSGNVTTPGDESPRVSVVMPIRNEVRYIERSCRSVLDQDYPSDRLQIIVADGMSNDGTREIITALQRQHHNIVLIDNPGRIVPTGMNAAIRAAEGDIIVRVDGHTVIEPDYIRNCVAELLRSGAENVGGRMKAISEGPLGQAIAAATSSRFGVGGARFHYSDHEEWVDTVYMGAWRKTTLCRVGLFDEEMVRNQDDEINYRIRAAGGRILLSPRIHSKYYNRATIPSLARQYYQYGYWKVRVLQKHPRQMQARQFVPAVLVASLIGFGSAALLFTPALWVFVGIGSLYLAANLLTSLILSVQQRWNVRLVLPLTFLTLHFAYGWGFIVGLFSFWNRWDLFSLSRRTKDEFASDKPAR